MSNPRAIVGSGNARRAHDDYPTPEYVTEALFVRETFPTPVWEPASGNGAMSKVIERYGTCVSSDVRTVQGIYGTKGVNFLQAKAPPGGGVVPSIVTNPPFSLAESFVRKAKTLAGEKFAFLLRLAFLEGEGRRLLLQDQTFPLARVWVFSGRVGFYGGAGMICYAWFVWDRSYSGPPTVGWVPARKSGGRQSTSGG